MLIIEYITACNALEVAVNNAKNELLSTLINMFTRAIWFNYIQERSTKTAY